MSASHAVEVAFAARFTVRVGEPAMRHLLSLRMQHARKLLREQHATVAASDSRVGYRFDVAFAAPSNAKSAPRRAAAR